MEIEIKDETSKEESIEDLVSIIPDYPDIDIISENNLSNWSKIKHPVIGATIKSVRKILQLKGLIYISKQLFEENLRKQIHFFKHYRQSPVKENLLFTTIHGAKNREFDYVIIIWPYEAPKEIISKRKLLYNAVTRAKKDVLILVQAKSNNKENLVKDPVFSLIVPL